MNVLGTYAIRACMATGLREEKGVVRSARTLAEQRSLGSDHSMSGSNSWDNGRQGRKRRQIEKSKEMKRRQIERWNPAEAGLIFQPQTLLAACPRHCQLHTQAPAVC